MNNCKKYILLHFACLLFSLAIIHTSFSQNINTFVRTFPASGMNGGLALDETADEGFIGTGQHGTSGAGSCDIYVYKVDPCGNPEWFKTYGATGEDGGKDIKQTSDGGYIVTGLAHLGFGDYDMTLLKLDNLGNIQWSKIYGGGAADYGLWVEETTDGGFITTGFFSGGGFGGEDLALVKTDANGNTQWMKIYGGAGSEWGDYVEQTPDGGYLAIGYTTSFGAGVMDIYMVKVDASGNLQWTKTYGGPAADGNSQWGISGKTTQDNGIIICANTLSFGSGSHDILLIKTDATGNLVWSKTYGGAADEQPRSCVETADKGFAIFGYTTSFGAGDLDSYLIKTDSMGNLQWSKTYGGAAYDKGSMAVQTPDGGYALSVVTSSFGADYFDPLFLKVDSAGNAGCHQTSPATIVLNVAPTVGSGGSEMVPTVSTAVPNLTIATYTPNDIYLCSHCTTVPNFIVSDSIVCINETFNVYNTTTVGKTCFEDWYLNGLLYPGDIDTLTLSFTTAGIQKIQLIANCGNSTDTSTKYVTVIAPPVASFTSTTVCKNLATQFTNTSTTNGTIDSSYWNFGDASPIINSNSPSYTYADSGTYSTILIVQSSYGCRDTVTNNVKVYGLPISNFTYQNICVSDSAHFTSTSTPNSGSTISTYLWNFGDGSPTNNLPNPAHKYSTEGTYTVMLVVSTNHGCNDTISKNIVIHPLPTPLFTTNSDVCHGKIALFTENSSITNTDTLQSWQWNFGDNSPLLNQQQVSGGHLYASTGPYNVTLTVTSTFGCIDSLSTFITVRPKPIANFSSTNECLGDLTEFSDSSTTATGTINLWTWRMGDGTPPKSSQNPTHTYATAGIFEATLIVQNNYGCADTIKKNVTVYFNPVANFTVEDVCLNDSVFLIDSSHVNISASISDYLWVFNDGSPTSTIQNPIHLYNTHGNYNVTLLTTTNQGCTDAISHSVSVFDPPQTAFSFNDVCLFDSALFINTSINPSMGTIASFQWSFGDGDINTSNNQPHHLYNAVGNYQITLITRSSNLACADTATDSITVFPMPIAIFTANDVCLGDAMNFFDSSTVTNANTVTAWAWNFGNGGATNSQQNPSTTYENFGQYAVQLIVTTNNACKDTVINNVVVHPVPLANFTTENICLEDTAFFFDQSTIDVNTTNDIINSWNWNFGDNATATAANTQHVFQSDSMFIVSLHITSSFGCTDSVNNSIVVNPNPTVIFSSSDTIGCEPLCIGFNNLSIIISGGNALWNWDFGDGVTSTNENSNHCYYNDSIFQQKLYSVTLTVTSDSGCTSGLTKSNYVTVSPLPVAIFNALPTTATITNPVIEFTDSSVGANFWSWNFGDNDTSTSPTPAPHTYADTGAYTVQLIVKTNNQCEDTAYQNVVIEPDFMFFVPTAFSPNDDGVNDSFIGKGIFINEFEMFIFDRWGNLVYQTDDLNKPWDGRVQNGSESAQTDVYVYSINLTNFKGDKYKYKGTVTLVR